MKKTYIAKKINLPKCNKTNAYWEATRTAMWYLYQKIISLKDLLKMAKVLEIKDGKNA